MHLWKYILGMRLGREIIWHGFLYRVYVSHVEILVRVGKLVCLRMGNVGGLFWVCLLGLASKFHGDCGVQSGVTFP